LTQNSHKVISINRYYQLSWLTLVTQQLFYWSTNRLMRNWHVADYSLKHSVSTLCTQVLLFKLYLILQECSRGFGNPSEGNH